MNVLDISYHILSSVNVERFESIGDGISNLKMQKLLYYAQKVSASIGNPPIFSETIEAWQYGPVVPIVYHNYKIFGSSNIDIISLRDSIKNRTNIDETESLIIDFTMDSFNVYSAGALVDMSHKEVDWINNYLPNWNNSIPYDQMITESLRERFMSYKNSLDKLSFIQI